VLDPRGRKLEIFLVYPSDIPEIFPMFPVFPIFLDILGYSRIFSDIPGCF